MHRKYIDWISLGVKLTPLLAVPPPPAEHQHFHLVPWYWACSHVVSLGIRNVDGVIPPCLSSLGLSLSKLRYSLETPKGWPQRQRTTSLCFKNLQLPHILGTTRIFPHWFDSSQCCFCSVPSQTQANHRNLRAGRGSVVQRSSTVCQFCRGKVTMLSMHPTASIQEPTLAMNLRFCGPLSQATLALDMTLLDLILVPSPVPSLWQCTTAASSHPQCCPWHRALSDLSLLWTHWIPASFSGNVTEATLYHQVTDAVCACT